MRRFTVPSLAPRPDNHSEKTLSIASERRPAGSSGWLGMNRPSKRRDAGASGAGAGGTGASNGERRSRCQLHHFSGRAPVSAERGGGRVDKTRVTAEKGGRIWYLLRSGEVANGSYCGAGWPKLELLRRKVVANGTYCGERWTKLELVRRFGRKRHLLRRKADKFEVTAEPGRPGANTPRANPQLDGPAVRGRCITAPQ